MRHIGPPLTVSMALAFLISWPALDHAAEMVLFRADELDGNHYEILGPAADALEAKHPLAATVLRRAMIDFALAKARTKRYRHAARHLLQCESLNQEITLKQHLSSFQSAHLLERSRTNTHLAPNTEIAEACWGSTNGI